MKIALFPVLTISLMLSNSLGAQSLQVSNEVTISSNDGNYHPQIEITGDGSPLVIWTNAADMGLYASKQINQTTFGTPIRISPAGFPVQSFDWSGADLAVEGSNVYVVFHSEGYETGHMYLLKSTDFGQTFGDTVRIDHLSSGFGQYPDVAVFNDTIYTTFMSHDANGMNPQYVLSRSVDGGQSFETPVPAGILSAAEACDCCPPEIMVNENQVVILFRNNDLNIRDIRAVLSYDRGQSFTQILEVDQHLWQLQACPSTGPDGRLDQQGMIYSTFKSVENNVGKIFLNVSDPLNASSNTTISLSDGLPNLANYPQLDLVNDTFACVFEANATQTDVFLVYSYNGMTGIDLQNRINITAKSNYQEKPDVRIHQGIFHIVYADVSALQYVSVSPQNSLEENHQKAIPKDLIVSKQQPALPELGTIELFSADGQSLGKQNAAAFNWNLYPCGFYYVKQQQQVGAPLHKLILLP